MSVTSDISDHHACMLQPADGLQHDYKLINHLTYNHYSSLSECPIESKFILLKKARFTNYMLPNNPLDLKLNIETFDPNDALSDYIRTHPLDPMRELFTSCKTPFIHGNLVNIHMVNYLKYLIVYLIWVYNRQICHSNPIIDVYLTDIKCFVELTASKPSESHQVHPVIIRIHVAGICYNSTIG
jgi:hypothetical protein